MMGSQWSHYTTRTLFPQFMAPTRDNAPMFLICWRIIKSIVCKAHCYKHLLADERKQHAKLTQENEIRCQADTGKDLHPLVFRSLLDLQAAVLRLNKVRSAPWLSAALPAPGWAGNTGNSNRGGCGRPPAGHSSGEAIFRNAITEELSLDWKCALFHTQQRDEAAPFYKKVKGRLWWYCEDETDWSGRNCLPLR